MAQISQSAVSQACSLLACEYPQLAQWPERMDKLGMSRLKLILFFLEQDIEGGQRTIATGDVLLHFHFLAVVKLLVGINFLL